eukprot:8423645-Alexandrium_andersonii.AAC.1
MTLGQQDALQVEEPARSRLQALTLVQDRAPRAGGARPPAREAASAASKQQAAAAMAAARTSVAIGALPTNTGVATS